MTDIGDYELHPFTVYAMLNFRDGNDPSRSEGVVQNLAHKIVDEIIELDDETKGLVIIDLLTMNNVFEQIISTLQLKLVEKGIEL